MKRTDISLPPSRPSYSEIPADQETALDRLEEAFDQFQKKQDHRWQALNTLSPRPLIPNDSSESSLVDFLKKGWISNASEHKALSQRDGAFLVPHSIQYRLNQNLEKVSIMRALARVATIEGDHLEVILDQKQAEVGWVSEVEDRKETETPTLHKLSIPVHHLYAKPRVTQQLLDDSQMDLESWLLDKIAHQMAVLENIAFLTGDGQGKPKGVLSYPCVPVGQAAFGKIESLRTGKKGGFLNSEVLIQTVNSLAPQYLNGSAWLLSRGALASIRLLKESGGDRYLWQPSLQQDIPSSLLGYPVHVCDGVPELQLNQSTKSIVFGHFGQSYQIVDRSTMTIIRDPFSAKPFVEFYANKRVGGDVINFDAVKVIEFEEI
jgi:HK97 family phage major capsid protein